MGRFYLDTEFTNSNYYLADIIETYTDSMLVFRNAGYRKPGLDALSQEFNIVMEVRNCHSALHDAELLMAICTKRIDLLLKLDHLHIFTFNGILLHIKEKLPTSIWTIFNLARVCSPCKERESKSQASV